MKFASLVTIAVAAAGLPLLQGAPAVALTSRATVLVDDREPAALRKAAADLASDLGKVFGKPVRVVNRVADAAPVTLCVGLHQNVPTTVPRPASSETLLLAAAADPWPGAKVRQAIVLTGSDTRGAIYAVYQFAQQFLGVDPMYFWTDQTPPRRATIEVPADLKVQAGPPSIRYRGWFINDEDLLTAWRPGAAGRNGIDLRVWDKIFETVLRLKGNMIVPGTFIFPDEDQVRAAGERGLIVTQHHIEVVGTNTYRWPDEQPYSFASRPDLLARAWAKAVEGYVPDQEVIWTVGYRGRHDRPFWTDDASAASTESGRGALIRRAIQKEMEIVRAHRASPYFLMNAWMEAVDLVRGGFLQIPDGVTLVWPDNGHGMIEDHGKIARGQGVYYHTAMHDFRANQLTERLPLDRIRRELGRAVRAGATEYLLVNTSDIRPVPLTTRAVMELAWNAQPWSVASKGVPPEEKYLETWCRDEFGAEAAPAVAACYRAYFAAPGRYGAEEWETFGDNTYFTCTRGLLLNQIAASAPQIDRWFRNWFPNRPYKDVVQALERAAHEAAPRWEQARDLALRTRESVPPSRRAFFEAHVTTQIDVHRYANRMLLEAIAAVRTESPASERRAHLARLIENAQSVQAALRGSEYGPWRDFFAGELFVDIPHTIGMARGLDLKLQGKPVPADLPLRHWPEDPYVKMKAYQGARKVPL
jgi:hypothetical protein